MEQQKLLEVYNSVLRSAVEYCSTVYHSMIPATLANRLEKIQRQALRIIYGWDANLDEIMVAKGIETLEERREAAVLRFALKNEDVGKYGKKWFKPAEETERAVRSGTRKKYKVPFCRTERLKSNPITYMTTKLNEHYSN